MGNLLQRTSLTQANGLAEVYVVYNGADYRMTLATLIALVTKASLGLENVANTSDLDKPISRVVQTALDTKAAKDAVPTLTAFNQLSLSLQNYVTGTQLTTAIATITTALNSYSTTVQMTAAIAAAMAPISTGLSSVTAALASVTDRVTTLENTNTDAVSPAMMNTAIAASRASVEQNMSDIAQSFSQSITTLNEILQSTIQTVNGLVQTVGGKANAVHTHDTASIQNLTEFVTDLMVSNGGSISVGPNDW